MPIQSRIIDEAFFPRPSASNAPPSAHSSPLIWPGVSHSSSNAIQEILADNHERWHVFFNERGFHNHIVHTVMSLWALGADEVVLRKAYENDSSYQRPAFTSPHPIHQGNWKDFLGNEKYYQAYLQFFKAEIKSSDHGFSKVFEKYIFSNDANVVSGSTGAKPEMLNRFLAGLLHPMIQTAFGLEFNLPGVVAEGLAQTAVHQVEAPKLLPLSYWSEDHDGSLASRLASALHLRDKASPSTEQEFHAFSVLARILADPNVAPVKSDSEFRFFIETHDKLGDAIREHAESWTIGNDDESFRAKANELIWTCALIYAVGGAAGAGRPQFNADFFQMHFVTSSIFLHTVLSHLTNPTSKEVFLRGYYHIVLAWYVSRGRPSLDIRAFFSNPETLQPSVPGIQPVPHEQSRPNEGKAALTPNPWLPIIQSTLTNPDEHLVKIQRALSEFAIRFGRVAPGGGGDGGEEFNFRDTELEGAGFVDGTLFIRAAVLTAQRVGWTREGEKPLEGAWDRDGFL